MDDVVDELGSRHRLAYVQRILEQVRGADRQIAAYNQSKNLTDVARYINSQFLAGI